MTFTIHITGTAPRFAAHVIQSTGRGADLLKGKRCISLDAAQEECRRLIEHKFRGIPVEIRFEVAA